MSQTTNELRALLDRIFGEGVLAEYLTRDTVARRLGCGACGDGCERRGSCRLANDSPSSHEQAQGGMYVLTPTMREVIVQARMAVNMGKSTPELVAAVDAMLAAGPYRPTAQPEADSWECFLDVGYFDLWCVRPRGSRKFGEGFHVVRKEEAHALRDALNSYAAQRTARQAQGGGEETP